MPRKLRKEYLKLKRRENTLNQRVKIKQNLSNIALFYKQLQSLAKNIGKITQVKKKPF